jgi:ubiquinone/menaquinone biosynthesis C-methylase UbiE
VRWAPGPRFALQFSPLYLGLGVGVSLTLTGLVMVWSSRVGKIRRREHLMNQLEWTGNERVLDVGCGRGLFLIAAAKRLKRGRATGIDIWRSEDLSGNRAEATLANARAEGVADRVQVETADMRHLPYPPETFDLVLSSVAIHNLELSTDRDLAITEIARVLKPGGFCLIDDVRHYGQYRDVFVANRCHLVRRLDNRVVSLFWILLTWGSLRPGTLLVRKAT